MSGYYAFVLFVSTWLAYAMPGAMPKATLDFSTIWTMELSSLLRIFGTWCFH